MPAARRTFLRTSLAAAAAPLVCRRFAFGRPAPSDKLAVAVIGLGNQGFHDTKAFLDFGDECRVVGVCDVNRGSRGYRSDDQFCGREPGKRLVNERYGESGSGCFATDDWRAVIGRDDVDAVVIVTPDHHHESMAVAACEAGKSVYCEKPLSWSIGEGRRMVEAAERNGTVFQTGSMHRSEDDAVRLVDLVRAGGVGNVERITTYVGRNNKVGPGPGWEPHPVPDGFDYAAWLGPAPDAPYHPDRCLYRFRFVRDYSGGQITNYGAHSNDLAGLCLPDAVPVAVTPRAATWPAPGALFSTAFTSDYELEMSDGTPIRCVTDDRKFGLTVEGSDGWVRHSYRGFEASSPELEAWRAPAGASIASVSLTRPGNDPNARLRNHVADFLRCVRTGETPVADAAAGHRTATLCHLGSLSLGLKAGYGERYRWDAAAERFTDAPAGLLAAANAAVDPRGAA